MLMSTPKPVTPEALSRRLFGIQALRGIAALSVVMYHAARHLAQAVNIGAIKTITQPGHAGVDLFFVLSGFIILYVHRGDIGRPETLGRYAWLRFARLMPIYWIALAATIAMMLHGHANEITAAAVALSATLLPTAADPLLGVAWTLQHEVIFYTAFAVLIFNRKLGLICFGLWLAMGLTQAAGYLSPNDGSFAIGRFTNLFNLQFLFGMTAAAAVTRGWIKTPTKTALVGGSLLVCAGVAEALGQIDGYGDFARFTYGIPCALLIAGLAAWELQRPRRINALLIMLGEASYSLYLFHLLGIAVAWQIWLRSGIDTSGNVLVCFLFLLISALCCGLFAHFLIEAPLLKRLRRLKEGTHGRRIGALVAGDSH